MTHFVEIRWTSQARAWRKLVDQVNDVLVDNLHTQQGQAASVQHLHVCIDNRLLDPRTPSAAKALQEWSGMLSGQAIPHSFAVYVSAGHATAEHSILLKMT